MILELGAVGFKSAIRDCQRQGKSRLLPYSRAH